MFVLLITKCLNKGVNCIYFWFQFDIILQMVKHNKIRDIGAVVIGVGDPEVATDKSIS